jgi:hypothetical protein
VSVTTDEHGAFLIEAPAFASVCVIAVDMHTLRARTVDAGALRRDIEIVFDDDPLRRIAGTVVDQWQRPIAGTQVSARMPLRSPAVAARIALGSRTTTTDANGRFVFDGLTTDQIDLFASVAAAMPATETIAADRNDVVITVHRCGHVRVLAAPDAGRAVFLDADGTPVPVVAHEGRLVRRLSEVPLFEGCSSVLRVPLQVVAVAIHTGDAEATRIPIAIVPDRLNVVRP